MGTVLRGEKFCQLLCRDKICVIFFPTKIKKICLAVKSARVTFDPNVTPNQPTTDAAPCGSRAVPH